MENYICNECGFSCLASYPFDCNRKEKTAERSNWHRTNAYRTYHYNDIEKLKKEAVEEYLKKANDVSEWPILQKWTGKRPISAEDLKLNVDGMREAITNYINEYSQPKEPELMTLQEAWEKANTGDKIESGEDSIIKNTDHKISFAGDLRDIFKEKWQIIPAEPKVLNIYKWIEDNVPMKFLIDGFTDVITECSKDFQRNGELKQWLNHKELREIARDMTIMKNCMDMAIVEENLMKLSEAVENLKSLEEK